MLSKDVASSSADGSSAKAKAESKAYLQVNPVANPQHRQAPSKALDIPSGLRGVAAPVPKSPADDTQDSAGDVASPTPLSGHAAAEPPLTETTGGRVSTRDGQPMLFMKRMGL